MKKLLHEIHEHSGSVYQLYAELADCANPAGYKTLTFSSIWTGAKRPELEQKKGSQFLSPEALKNLKSLLEESGV